MMNDKVLNVVAIFAHPDDLTFYGSGTLARWVEEGHTVYALCCTSGEVGTLRLDLTKEDVAKMRSKELRASNEILGLKETIILDYPDAGFIDGAELRKTLVYYVRKLKADRVMTFDPWVKYEVHPDHVIVGRMAAEAAAFASFPLLYSEQLTDDLKPHACSEIWFMGMLAHYPNYFVDISTTLNKKISAAMKFEATVTLLADLFAPNIDPANVSEKELKKLLKYATNLLRSVASVLGKEVDLKVAEAFYVQKLLPGHFDNFQQSMAEMLGKPQGPPNVY